jgi:hypothetical protein
VNHLDRWQLADVDRDGRPDLVIRSDDCCDREPGVHWFRRGADGRFTAMGEFLVSVAGIRDNESDGDGWLDVLAVPWIGPVSSAAGNLR